MDELFAIREFAEHEEDPEVRRAASEMLKLMEDYYRDRRVLENPAAAERELYPSEKGKR